MKYVIASLCALSLSACVSEIPNFLIHKEGSMYDDRMRQKDLCQFEAANAIPSAMAAQMSGGYYNPGSLHCSTVGTYTTCNNVGAINIPATATTYDANAELRERYVHRCLESAGYSVIPKPLCRSEADKRTYQASLDNQPPAYAIPCAGIL